MRNNGCLADILRCLRMPKIRFHFALHLLGNFNSLRLRSFGVFLFLLAVCIFGYWNIATFQDTLKWDMLDCYYPWKFFVGESIKHQVFPLWNPYQHLGYPIYADLRSVFYPETILIGLLGGYNLKVLHFLFILNITLAGFGVYKLSGVFTTNDWARLTAATSYILCGFFVGHGQEMFGIIAATWIPWILNYFLRFQQSLAWNHLWKLALVLFLQLTGGYQALSLMLFYLLLFLFLTNAVSKFRLQGAIGLRKLLGMHTALAVVVICSLTVLLVTYFQVSPYAERMSGVSLDEANFNAINWRALTSFFTPYGVTTSGEDLGIDISMANLYVGLLWLPLYFLGILRKKAAYLKIILLFGLLTLLASMGPLTPVREFFYNYVPAMDMFRMSSFFSYFTQLSIILIGAVELGRLLDAPSQNIKRFNLAVSGLALFVVGIGFYHYTTWPDAGLEALRSLPNLFSLGQEFSFSQRIVLQAALQLMLLSALLISVQLFWRKARAFPIILFAFVFIEMALAGYLNYPVTVGGGHNPTEMQSSLSVQPSGFPLPSLNKSVRFNTENKKELSPLWHNTNIYTKTVSSDGFNSFRIDRFENYRLNTPAIFDKNLDQSLLFLLPQRNSEGITLTDYQPNKIVCEVTITQAGTLVLQQTFYPGWAITVDGNTIDFSLFEDIFPSVELTAGNHSVVFSYENKPVIIGFGISATILLLILLTVFYGLVLERTSNRKTSLLAAVAIGVVLLGSIGYAYSQTESVVEARLADYNRVLQRLDETVAKSVGATLFLQVDDPIRMQKLLTEKGWNQNVKAVGDLWGPSYMELRQSLKADSANRIIVLRINQPEDGLMNELIRDHYPTKQTVEVGRDAIYVFDKSAQREVLFTSLNNFDVENPLWGFNSDRIDSASQAFSGQFGWTIGEKELGTPAFHQPIGKLTNQKQLQFVFSLKALIPDGKPKDAHVYIQVLRGEDQLWQIAERIDIYAQNNIDWFDVTVLAIPSMELKEDDEIRAFVWSNPSTPLYLDDTRITVYAED